MTEVAKDEARAVVGRINATAPKGEAVGTISARNGSRRPVATLLASV